MKCAVEEPDIASAGISQEFNEERQSSSGEMNREAEAGSQPKLDNIAPEQTNEEITSQQSQSQEEKETAAVEIEQDTDRSDEHDGRPDSTQDKSQPGSTVDRPQSGSTVDRPQSGSTVDRPQSGSTVDRPHSGGTVDRPHSGSTGEQLPSGSAQEMQRSTSPTRKAEEERIPSPNSPSHPTEMEDEPSQPIDEGIEDVDPVARSSVNPSPDQISTESGHLDMINQKRQEEREAFQKLISECTSLQAQLDKTDKIKDDLQTKQDILSIELDTEKDKNAEQKEQIQALELRLTSLLSKQSASAADQVSSEEKNALLSQIQEGSQAKQHLQFQVEDVSAQKAKHEADIKDLNLKIKRMAQDDREKSEKITQLESRITEHENIIKQLEQEFGAEKVAAVRDGKNQNGAAGGTNTNPRASNTVSLPPTAKSSVCSIM